jgi:hypothetical protein
MGTIVESRFKRRAAMVNGIYYPENPDVLAEMLSSWGLKAGSATGGQAILVPHGNWNLTGDIAASAFKSVQKKAEGPGVKGPNVNRIIIFGANHQYTEEGIYLSESSSFETPQGDLPVDQKLNQLLASCSTLIRTNDIPHLCEHSLEVLLPLIKHCFPGVKIIPILMCGRRPMLISCLAKALRVTFEEHMEESLIVVSSNVSRNFDPALALSMADEFRTILEAMDTRSFLTCLADSRISACGAAILGALLESGLLDGKKFSSVCPLVQNREENGETVCHGAFAA